MTGPDAKVPTNIFYFEVLLYMSLFIDAASMPFRDYSVNGMADDLAPVGKLITAVMILLFVYLIWLAAHRRKNWARMILLGALALSVASITATVGETGIQFSTFVDVISTALTAAGLFFSFTGDARYWFHQPRG